MTKQINLLIIIFLLISCNSANNLNYDNIKIENGVYINAITHDILDGKYVCKEERTVIELEYDNGRPVNNWKELNSNKLIHSGYYILEPKVSQEIKKLTESDRVDLNVWTEVNYCTLNIELITPKKIGLTKQEKIVTLIDKELLPKYKFEGIRIHIIEPSSEQIKVLR